MKKEKYMTILWAIAVVALVAAAIFMLADRIAGTTFSDIVPNTKKFEACQIFCITVERDDTATVSGDDLDALLSELEQYPYHKGGTHGSAIEGTLYHLHFTSRQEEPVHVIVSDLGKLYVGENYYELDPEVPADSLSNFIETVFQ